MSQINVKRQITGPILRALAKDVEKDRKTFEKQLGQIFIFEPSKIRKLVKDLAAQFELKEPNGSEVNKAISLIRATLIQREQAFRNVYGKKVDRIKKSIVTPLKPEDQMFVIRSFGTINRIKRGKLVSVLRDAFRSANSNKEETLLSSKFKFDITGFGGSGLHVGHGELGTPVTGLAVSRSLAKLDKLIEGSESTRAKAKLQEVRTQITTQISDTLNVDIPYDLLITKDGKFRRTFAPILSFQDARENLLDSSSDKRIKKIVENVMGNIDHAAFEGSTSPKDAVAQTTLYNLTSKKVRSTGRKRPVVKEKGRAKDSKKTTTKSRVTIHRSNFYSQELEKQLVQPQKRNNTVSPLSLIAVLNSRIQNTIVKNMGFPSLEHRSGKFAESVKILDINFTNKGFPSIGYTYDKNPYQVFELGRGTPPWATAQRDPRAIIEKSIREVASELIIGRFFTRRL